MDVRIVGVVGSLRDGSYTRKIVKIALDAADLMGAETEMIDLKDYHLVFPFQVPKEAIPEDIAILKEKLRTADGVILGTPEYHGSFSGVIKTFLDLMGFEEFEGKMIGLVGVGGGTLGAINALNGLRAIGRQLHAWVIPDQASIPRPQQEFDGEKLKNPRLQERVEHIGRQVTRFAVMHQSKEVAQFVKEWEKAPKNPGLEDRD